MLRALAVFDDDFVFGGPLLDVCFLDRGDHEVGELVGGAGEGWGAEGTESAGDAVVVDGGAFVVEGEKGYEAGAGADEAADALVEFVLVAAFDEVADEDEDGFVGTRIAWRWRFPSSGRGMSLLEMEDSLGERGCEGCGDC